MSQANRAKKWRDKNPAKFRLSLDKSAIRHFLSKADGDQLNWLFQSVKKTIHEHSHTAERLTDEVYRIWPDIDKTVLSGRTSVKIRIQQWLKWHPADVIRQGLKVAEILSKQHPELKPLDVVGYCVTHPLTAEQQIRFLEKE